jgi:hypothetical protein
MLRRKAPPGRGTTPARGANRCDPKRRGTRRLFEAIATEARLDKTERRSS